ncbi:MAG: PEP-CTERM sorting domain-containing protein [Motiliproteus sp.]
MKLKLVKTALAATALSFAVSAHSNDIYMDAGKDYNGDTGFGGLANNTDLFSLLTYFYGSSSTITDTSGDGLVGTGDTIVSSLSPAIAPNACAGANICSFGTSPGDFGGAFDGNGYPAFGWRVGFDFTNITGTLSGTGINFSAGTIKVIFDDASNAAVHMFDLNVTAGSILLGKQIFTGTVGNFQGTALAGLAVGHTTDDIMHIILGGVDKTFKEADDLVGVEPISFEINQTVQDGKDLFTLLGTTYVSNGALVASGGNFSITANHDSNTRFSIPEPAPIALMGLSLLGLGFMRRFKKA